MVSTKSCHVSHSKYLSITIQWLQIYSSLRESTDTDSQNLAFYCQLMTGYPCVSSTNIWACTSFSTDVNQRRHIFPIRYISAEVVLCTTICHSKQGGTTGEKFSSAVEVCSNEHQFLTFLQTDHNILDHFLKNKYQKKQTLNNQLLRTFPFLLIHIT